MIQFTSLPTQSGEEPNFVQEVVVPGTGKTQEGLDWFRHYPTVKVYQPRMNSLRELDREKDLPLPLSERPFDNEFDFKGDPYKLDGWLARTVTQVEVSAEDSKVWYALDHSGLIYRSLDGGETWTDIWSGLGGARVNAFALSPHRQRLLVAATDRGLYRSDDGGTIWFPIITAENGSADWVIASPSEENVFYARIGGRIHRSLDQGEEHFAKSWKRIDGVPAPVNLGPLACGLGGEHPVFLASQGSQVWNFKPEGGDWLPHADLRYQSIESIHSHPTEATHFYAIASANFWGKKFRPLLESRDGGKEWDLLGSTFEWNRQTRGRGKGLEGVPIVGLAVDGANPTRMVAAAGRSGAYLSEDAGLTWKKVDSGLDIPIVDAVSAPSSGGKVFAGTPAGVYVLQGEGWQSTGLVPQGVGCRRRETGPADFLAAYWLGRYHGFITEQDAQAPWSE